VESRLKRLEETIARLNAQKSDIEARLAEPALYQDAAALKALLVDQAYVAKEIDRLETEWLGLM
jgi:ATP-binding cassette subfamily F protein 3